MVRIQFKTLQQKQFFIEAEPTETVRPCALCHHLSPSLTQLSSRPQVADLKKKIHADQGFPVESQKIIFSGAYRAVRSLSSPLTLRDSIAEPSRQDPPR